ncbi:fumarylacetoacetate hydrolase family protein [Marinithermus hydrothermalis]|uniref:5-carboxymethyl-2-hydroxymuconateDelta-isomerase n=1 Tax=Marinithermus hydrothermalis (strain DSM 14884 / JCM 11576 / T1) TaxID=869210 RepID=F2NQT9_MARHT|nr:fumarylacetoacetate hydrolase family protein [Marinithermus hydrothermalis]AEB12303.1 5-carboxymethyl-2-hydroxymuconateDelta-isomerase [Marinithermus hydrothermalis DSM 14884]
MKLVRFNEGRWGVLEGRTIQETEGPAGATTGRTFALEEVRLRAPATPGAIVCVGRNYLDHIREMGHDFGKDLPQEPGLFLKAPNALADPDARVAYPSWTKELHYEGELALVIGKPLRNVSEEAALEHVLGYTCALDLTARDKQRTDLQWTRAKSADGFCPLGPWLETALDPQAVTLRTRVNGTVRQEASTRQMIFPVARVLSYISTFMTLRPGDVVLTGTPEGVGPLRPGDEVVVEIEGIGALRTQIVEEAR